MPRIFDHILKRDLSHVTRFNNKPQHFEESVAEHSFYVAYFALIICNLLEKKKIKIDRQKALSMALIHDMEESFSGDILTPLKHFNEKVNQAIREVNNEIINEVFEDLPSDLAGSFINLWHEEGTEKTIESQVVKVADKLSLLSKCFEEIQAGNNYFEDIYKPQLSKLKQIDWDWWKKIKDEIITGADKEI